MIPNLSVSLAVVLGVVAVLAIIAFIDHSAHSMDVSRILARATADGVATVRHLWDEPGPRVEGGEAPHPPADHLVVEHADDGWIQHIDLGRIVHAAPEGGTLRLETETGRYAVAGTPLCTIWPVPDDVEEARRQAHGAVVVGSSRTAQQDVGYGVRQLADVALRALSPGINDPTTAQDAVFHAATVVGELLTRQPPPLVSSVEGSRVLVRPERLTHAAAVALAFDEVRIAATGMPTVAVYLLQVLQLLDLRAGHQAEVHEALVRQAALIRQAADQADVLPADADRIREAHDRRFGAPTP